MSHIECQVGDLTTAGRRGAGQACWSSPLRAAARGVLLVALLLAPWPFGSVELASQKWLGVALVLALVLWITATTIDAIRGSSTVIHLPLTALPLTCFLALGAVQLVPFGNQEFWEDGPPSKGVIEDSARSVATEGSAPFVRSTFSLYPASTRVELARATLACLAWFLGTVLFRRSRHQIWLWALLACNGAVLAFVGIALQSGGNIPLFGNFAGEHASSFATFVNRNNAAGYLNLCLAAGIGLIIWLRGDSDDSAPAAESAGWKAVRNRRWAVGTRIAEWLARLDVRQLAAFILAALVLAGVLCTLSRGGILAAVAAGGATAVAGFRIRGRHVATGSVAILLALSLFLISWTESGTAIRNRLSTLADGQLMENPRIAHWQDAVKVAADFPLLGSGLGTYRYVYLPYQERPVQVWFYHAENQYLQVLVEAGSVGLLVVLSAFGAALGAVCFLLRHRRDARHNAVALAGLFAVAAQGLHAFTDFGLFIPANFLTFSVILGVVTGAAAERQIQESGLQWLVLPRWNSRSLSFVAAGVLCFTTSSAVWELSAAARAEAALQETQLPPGPDGATVAEIDRWISLLEDSVTRRPDDPQLRTRLAELWIRRYRLEAYELLGQQGNFAQDAFNENTWQLTTLAVAHQRANALANAGEVQAFDAFRTDPIVTRNLAPAVEHLQAARASCPIFPDVDLALAALSFVQNLGSPSGLESLHRAVALAPGNAQVLFEAGGRAFNAGQEKLGIGYWRRSLELEPRRCGHVLEFLSGRMPFEVIATRVIPRSPGLLVGLIKERFAGPEHAAKRAVLASQAWDLLQSADRNWHPAERSYFTAVCHRYQGRPGDAIGAYREAVALRPLDVEWRFELAQLLYQQGRTQEALTEARLCQSLEPDRRDVHRWIQARIREREPDASLSHRDVVAVKDDSRQHTMSENEEAPAAAGADQAGAREINSN